MDVEREGRLPHEDVLTSASFSATQVPARLRIVLVDRQPMFRSGLRFELERLGDCVVLGEATGIRDLWPLLPQNPDLLLLRADDASDDVLDLLREIDRAGHRIKTLLVSSAAAPVVTAEAVRLGVIGTLPSTVDASLLRRCIDAVRGGECWFRRDNVSALIRSLTGSEEPTRSQGRPFGLTQREFEVVLAVAEGLSNREIGSRLSIREDTVKHHLSAAFDKTGTFGRVELAVFALNHRLTTARPRRTDDR